MASLPPVFARLSGLGPLPRLFEAGEGGPALGRLLVESELRIEGLPPTTPVPFASLNEIFNRASRLSGDPLFPLRVAEAMIPEDYGPMVSFALQGATLGDGIGRLVRMSPLQSNATRLTLRNVGHRAHWSLLYHSARGLRVQHHALHVLVPMINFIRRYAGSTARSFELRLVAPADPSIRALEDALAVPIRTGADEFAVVFPSEWLGLARTGRMTVFTLRETLAYYRREALPRSMSDTVAALIAPAVGETGIDLDVIASRLAVSRRTLQQRLNAEGSSFRDISLRVRIARAKDLIAAAEAPIAQVALAVGYSDQAHFTRAFKTLTGSTPQEFRQTLRPGRLVAAE